MFFHRNFRYSIFYCPGSKKRCDPPKARTYVYAHERRAAPKNVVIKSVMILRGRIAELIVIWKISRKQNIYHCFAARTRTLNLADTIEIPIRLHFCTIRKMV